MNTFTREEVLKASTLYFKGDLLAADVFTSKYAMQNSSGLFLEKDPNDTFDRLAKEFARIEKKYPNPLSYEEIREALDGFKYIVAQGSPMSAIGNNNQIQSVSNCFTLEAPYDSYGGILKTDQELCQIAKRRGGIGFDISTIRPKGLPTKNSAKTTDGIAVFMERFSNSCREVAQNGRRGALMLTISIKHPEIETFINIKKDLKKVTGANISVRVTDDFMRAVETDSEFTLQWPVDSLSPSITRVIKAKDLWNNLIEAAWASAEPGILFWDTALRNGPADIYEQFRSVSTNPCSEIFLSPYDSCRLMLLNLFSFVENPYTKEANFNFELYEKYIRMAQRLMDDLVDLEIEAIDKILNKIVNDPEPDDVKILEINLWNKIKKAAEAGRRTGLGITALGDTFAALNIKYGSETSISNTDFLYKKLANCAHAESIQLAKERGAFPAFSFDLEKNHAYLNSVILDSSKKDWEMYGRRNVSLTTTAPVGSLSILTRTSSGIEPAFMISSIRRKKNMSNTDRVDFIDDLGDKWQEYKVYHYGHKLWQDKNSDKTEEESPYNGATALDIDWIKSVDIQAAAQKWVDHAISKCVQEGTLIATNKGIFPIEKLSDFEYQEEDTFSEPNDDYCVLDENGNQKKILRHYYGGKKDCYRIKFNNGFSLTASENHMLKSSDGWKKIKDIKVGESIQYRTNSIKDIDKNQLVLLEKVDFKNNIKREFPEYCDENFAKFLGMWLADGYVTSHSIGIVEKDDKVCSEIQRLILSIFNIKSIPSIDKRSGVRTHVVNSTAIASFFKKNFGKNCVTKHVPDFILKSSFDIQKSFIEGLSLDGYLANDGSLVIYDGYSENIANSVSYILSKNGIKYLLTQKKVKDGKLSNISYGVRCYLHSKIFEPIEDHKKEYKLDSGLKNINIFLDEKAEAFYNENYDKSTKNSEIKQRIKRSLKSSRFIRKSLLQSANLLNFVDENLLSIKVVSIDFVGEKEVYDIEVEDSHSYLINGVVSHNTCNLPNSASKELVSEIYINAWKKGCKGFTIYREGSRSGVLLSNKSKQEGSFKQNNAIKRPNILNCDIHHTSIKGEKWVIFIGKLYNKPYEIFGGKADKIQFPSKYKLGSIEKDKGLSKYNLIIEEGEEVFVVKDILATFDNAENAIHTRLLSLSMRHGAPVKYIVDQLQKDTNSNLFDFSKVIARVLKKYIEDGESSQKCEKCMNKLSFQEGCLSCSTCGMSKCS